MDDNRRYKKGDKVRIVQYDADKFYKFGFVDDMHQYCGKIMTISGAWHENHDANDVEHHLLEDEKDFMWSISMFEKDLNPKFINLDYHI